MLKLLVKKQITEIFRSYFYDQKKNRKRSTGSTIAFFVMFGLLMVVLLGGMFTLLSLALCFSLVSAGMGWFYFTIMTLLALLLGVFGSVFNTYSSLYLSKDNDLLLSLPIPTGCIIASRLLSVYLMGLVFRRCDAARHPRLLDLRRIESGQCIGLSSPIGVRFRAGSGALLPAGLGGGKDQPEAEKQELYHRIGVAGVLRCVLCLLLPDSVCSPGPH